MPRILPFLLLLPGLSAATSVMAEPVNPFARPVQDVPSAPADAEAVTIIRPELRGVIVAGTNSIANLNGKLLSVGEEASGYQLEDVAEGSATFRHQGQLVTLELMDPAAENAR